MAKELEFWVDRARYPKDRLFRPVEIGKLKEGQETCLLLKAFDQLFRKFDADCRELQGRRKFGESGATFCRDVELHQYHGGLDAWAQDGMCWRRVQYLEPGRRTHFLDLKDNLVLWRNAPGAYCSYGFPYFRHEWCETAGEFMETKKPLVHGICTDGREVLISMHRHLLYPQGTCWGVRTGDTYYTVELGQTEAMLESKAALRRHLQSLLQPGWTPPAPRVTPVVEPAVVVSPRQHWWYRGRQDRLDGKGVLSPNGAYLDGWHTACA